MDPIKYPWSSLGSYVGARTAPSWLTVRDVMSQFGSKGKRGYREFVAEGIKEGIRTPWDEGRGQKYYGNKPEEMKERGWRYTEPRYVASYFLMRRYGLMGLREIGERVGLHFSAVGNAVQRVADNPHDGAVAGKGTRGQVRF